MGDAAPDAPQQQAQRFDIAKVVVLSGWSLTIAVCLVVIATSVALDYGRGELATLDKRADLCLGFLLGTFVTLVRDFIKVGS